MNIQIRNFCPDGDSNSIIVKFNVDGIPVGFRWNKRNPNFEKLRIAIKGMGATWDGNLWTVPDRNLANKFCRDLRHRKYDIVEKWDYRNGHARLIALTPHLWLFEIDARYDIVFWGERIRLLTANYEDGKCMATITSEDARIVYDDLVRRKGIHVQISKRPLRERKNDKKVKVIVDGWMVEVIADPKENPTHLLLAEIEERWTAPYPYGKRIEIPWNGIINTTRSKWKGLKSRMERFGVSWEGADPETLPLRPIVELDSNAIPGWHSPAACGKSLYKYQREGIEFVARSGLRALIGDEMGVGKTAQAISAARGAKVDRILIVCPANARYVWEREIKNWSWDGSDLIHHIRDKHDSPVDDTRWLIVTYDQLVIRQEIMTIADERDKKQVEQFLKKNDVKIKFTEIRKINNSNEKSNKSKNIQDDKKGWKITLSSFVPGVPGFHDSTLVEKWNKIMHRLNGALVNEIKAWKPGLLIMDEAHRAKNNDSKRTGVARAFCEHIDHVLLLTGTPLRNNEHEAAVLLSLLDPGAKETFIHNKRYGIADIKEYLSWMMIRRTKQEVLPELPPKILHRVDLDINYNDSKVTEYLESYIKAIEFSYKCYEHAIFDNKSEAQAREAMRPGLNKARQLLGLSKVATGEVTDLIAEVVEEKGSCVIFVAHHAVSDMLSEQLRQSECSVVVVDGRMPQDQRAQAEMAFQRGEIQVFIGGINSAGESITLTRSDIVVFVAGLGTCRSNPGRGPDTPCGAKKQMSGHPHNCKVTRH